MRVMLDTNAYSALMRGDSAIAETVAHADEVMLPTPTLAELRAGFRVGSRESENNDVLARFLSRPRVQVHPLGEATAVFYAEVYSALRKAGTPIPTNDLWIAAAALESGSILVSNDAHFDVITGLVRK